MALCSIRVQRSASENLYNLDPVPPVLQGAKKSRRGHDVTAYSLHAAFAPVTVPVRVTQSLTGRKVAKRHVPDSPSQLIS